MKVSTITGGLAGFAAVLVIAGTGILGQAWAMGSDDDAAAKPDTYKQAEKLIDDEKYADAIPLLQQLVKEKGAYADALNLLGYSHRKSGNPTAALDYYNQALAMEPEHLGANEYLGELYLELMQPEKAKERLAVLKNACGDCDEYEELEEAIEKHASIN